MNTVRSSLAHQLNNKKHSVHGAKFNFYTMNQNCVANITGNLDFKIKI